MHLYLEFYNLFGKENCPFYNNHILLYFSYLFIDILDFSVFDMYSIFNKQNKDEKSNSNAQKSGNNDTQTNSSKNGGVNSNVKNQLKNTESNSNFNIYLNNGGKDNQEIKSEGSIKGLKEYFNQPEENKNNRIGSMKSINVIQMNNNGNIAQNDNNPGICSAPKSFAQFY